NIIKYLRLTDVSTNEDPFYFAWQFHDTFNNNLVNAVLPGSYLCIDESMCQWMGKVDKATADAQINLILRLDPVEPSKYTTRKKILDRYPPTVASVLRLTEPWFHSGRTIIGDSWFGSIDTCVSLYDHGLYSILQIKKRRYWPKKIPYDITSALEDEYSSFVSRTCSASNVDLTLCSIRNCKDIVLLASCSMTILGSEVRWYIKDYGIVTFHHPVIFDNYCEHKSAIDIVNNLHDNSLSYHDVLVSKHSMDHIFAFYLSVAEANSFSTYCRFVPGKRYMKHMDF
ncbi:40853_t:CDS:2, partial [Gigaspora margarita]